MSAGFDESGYAVAPAPCDFGRRKGLDFGIYFPFLFVFFSTFIIYLELSTLEPLSEVRRDEACEFFFPDDSEVTMAWGTVFSCGRRHAGLLAVDPMTCSAPMSSFHLCANHGRQ